MRRFTLSYHYFTQRDTRNHLELFLDVADDMALETWRCFRSASKDNYGARRRFTSAPAHRRVYLDFAGKISGDRGKLRIVRRGFFVDRRTGRLRSSERMEALLTDDRRTRKSEVFAAHEVHPGENQRTRKSVVRTAQDVHPSANRRTENVMPTSILVTL